MVKNLALSSLRALRVAERGSLKPTGKPKKRRERRVTREEKRERERDREESEDNDHQGYRREGEGGGVAPARKKKRREREGAVTPPGSSHVLNGWDGGRLLRW